MKKEAPVKVSQAEVVFKVEEIEPILCGPAMNVKPFEPCVVKIKTKDQGEKTMVVRPLEKDEVPKLMPLLKSLLDKDSDFYDIVGARVLAEVLGWYRNRLKDPYQMVGIVDGELAGFCNGRMVNQDISISLHTLAFKRGMRVGAILYYLKAQYCFETVGQKEFHSTFESYNGWKRWGVGMAQPSYPWPEIQHELGGARVYYIRKDYWDSTVKKYLLDMVKADISKPVPKDLLEKSKNFKVPNTVEE